MKEASGFEDGMLISEKTYKIRGFSTKILGFSLAKI